MERLDLIYNILKEGGALEPFREDFKRVYPSPYRFEGKFGKGGRLINGVITYYEEDVTPELEELRKVLNEKLLLLNS